MGHRKCIQTKRTKELNYHHFVNSLHNEVNYGGLNNAGQFYFQSVSLVDYILRDYIDIVWYNSFIFEAMTTLSLKFVLNLKEKSYQFRMADQSEIYISLKLLFRNLRNIFKVIEIR